MGYQQTTIIGNLAGDAELEYTSTGTPMARFSVAVTESWTGKDGQKQEDTTWYRCTAFAKQAEFAEKWVKKGKPFMFKGKVKASGFTDRDGNAQASLNMKISEIIFLPDTAFKGNGGGNANGSAAPEESALSVEDVPF